MKRWLLISVVLMAAFPCGLRAFAQEDRQDSEPEARKFDAFEHAYGCDHGARLDNFAIQLQNEPAAIGYVICYGPASEGNGSGQFRCRLTVEYLVQTRGTSPDQIKTVYGGRYKELKMSAVEFWIVPPGAELPEPQKYENPMTTFIGKFDERPSWDNTGFEEGTGPSTGDATFAAYADLIQQQPDTLAYLVAYSTKGSAPGAWRRAAKELADRLEADYKIAADRIKILCGGYNTRADDEAANSAQVQLWIVPKNSPPPVVEVRGPEPAPEGAIQIGQFDDLSLDDAAHARRVFQGFADVLSNDVRMQACVIIRLAKRTEEDEKQDKKFGLTRADLPTLVAAWQNDLEEKFGISRDRLFILTAEAGQYQSGSVETWLVPKGAQLPDPNAFEEEQPLTEEEMNAAEDNVLSVDPSVPKY